MSTKKSSKKSSALSFSSQAQVSSLMIPIFNKKHFLSPSSVYTLAKLEDTKSQTIEEEPQRDKSTFIEIKSLTK